MSTPQKTNKRVSKFPPATSVKKLKFSFGVEKENVVPQFSLSLPVACESKPAPSTPTTRELNFSDPSTPRSPETPSTPSTPPTPRVIHSDDEDACSQEDTDWLKSDGFEIKSTLQRNLMSDDADSGESFLRSNIAAGSFYNGNEGSGSFINGSGSFAMNNEISNSGAYVNGNANNGAYINGVGATFGTSGSFLNRSGNFVNNNGSFVNNAPTTAAMPPPRPVKRTPANNHTNHNIPHSAGVNGYVNKPGGFVPLMRRRSSSLSSLINPFTPEGRAIKEAKEAHNPSYRKMLEEATLPKNWNAHTIQALIRQPPASGSIYRLLFEELEVIGRGAFGEVTKCRQKIDGCAYAIKRTIRQLRGKKDRMIVLREVYGLAAIQQHDHIVPWEEDNRIFMQMELCEGGTLQSWVDSHVEATEVQLLTVLRHTALGLSYIHSQGLVHLDVKPENIYIKYSVQGEPTSEPIYKIGDLGLLNEADNSKVYMEGDSRYLSRELLQDDMTGLRQSDIFALGASLYELARRQPLPRNGPEWAEIRDGVLHLPGHFSPEFCQLLLNMVNPKPAARPSAADIARHPLVMMVAKVPSLEIKGLEGCTCERGKDALEVLKSQVEFYRKEMSKLQASLPNNPSNPNKPVIANPGGGVQNILEQMSL